MRAPEPMPGLRLVGAAAMLDGLSWPSEVTALRLAADDVLALGASEAPISSVLTTAPDAGWMGWWLGTDELERVRHHTEWPLVAGLNQGLVAGVPAKVWLGPDRSLLLVARAYASELEARL